VKAGQAVSSADVNFSEQKAQRVSSRGAEIFSASRSLELALAGYAQCFLRLGALLSFTSATVK
jgi:hypothetical protein